MSNDKSNDILNEILLKDGKKLILRKPLIEDAENIVNYLNLVGGESNNLLFGKDEFRFNVEQEKEFIKNINNDMNSIMILGLINNIIVSVALISGNNRKRIAHNSELAISVKKDFWNAGIGRAVMNELIHFVKEHDTIKIISLGVKASNLKAINMYEKCGFIKVGIHKNYFNINGEFDDEILMDMYL
jgi:RimJ/RimL family protein N-acetyltransferase